MTGESIGNMLNSFWAPKANPSKTMTVLAWSAMSSAPIFKLGGHEEIRIRMRYPSIPQQVPKYFLSFSNILSTRTPLGIAVLGCHPTNVSHYKLLRNTSNSDMGCSNVSLQLIVPRMPSTCDDLDPPWHSQIICSMDLPHGNQESWVIRWPNWRSATWSMRTAAPLPSTSWNVIGRWSTSATRQHPATVVMGRSRPTKS